MQTNQTPEALAEECQRLANQLGATSLDRSTEAELRDAINRLRDMAASGAKDAEPVGVVEMVRPASVVNAAGGYQTFEPRPEVRWGVRGMPPAGTTLYAAIAATKRGGA